MKVVLYENIYNKERFVKKGKVQTKFIDGNQYLELYKEGTERKVLVRKDFLKPVNTK